MKDPNFISEEGEFIKQEIEPGIFLVHKPAGISSFGVVNRFKGLFPGQKVGHAGTLDPLAEGLLIVLVGKATKKQSSFLGLDKEYLAEIAFGATSRTYDLESELILAKKSTVLKRLLSLKKSDIVKATGKFLPGYRQRVPGFSAVKKNGVPLYRLARKNDLPIELPIKEVAFYEAEILSFRPGSSTSPAGLDSLPLVRMRLKVSKGFYVRSFAADLGEKLGVGGVLTKLTRTAIGKYCLPSEESIAASEGR